jgi:NADPH2:quinone reductase
MRAAQVKELGQPPEPVEIDEPSGDRVAEMVVVALNPIDLAVGAGRFYGGHPDLPYVPGFEGVARVDGKLAYVFGGGMGLRRDGTLAQRVDLPEGAAVELPDGVDPALAAACGIAGVAGWAPVTLGADVREGDRVLVLAATGTVGVVALQAAKLRGAARIVAAGRNAERLERARELGADDVVQLDGDLEQKFKDAFDGEGPTVVIDPVWGKPVEAAANAAAPGARIIQIGQSAGTEATFTSAAVRGKQLRIQGHSNFGLTDEQRDGAYLELGREVQAGRVTIEVERFPLDRVADAWAAQAGGTKAIVELAI